MPFIASIANLSISDKEEVGVLRRATHLHDGEDDVVDHDQKFLKIL